MSAENSVDWRKLVYRQVESDTLDYKAPLNWIKLSHTGKAKFVRHCLAFANTKGGYVVVGVQEDASGHPSVYTGLNADEVKSFDPSTVGQFVNRMVDPPIDFTIERPLIDGKRYAIFVIKPFTTVPHVCTGTLNGELLQGVFYIRTTDASSRPAYRASEMHGLIQRALRNQREMLGSMLRSLLYENHIAEETCADSGHFAEEWLHAGNFFSGRRQLDTQHCQLEIVAMPPEYKTARFRHEELKQAGINALPNDCVPDYLTLGELESCYFANTSIRVFPANLFKMWQLYASGFCYYGINIPTPDNELPFQVIADIIRSGVYMLADLYTNLGFVEDRIKVQISLSKCGELKLHGAGTPPRTIQCGDAVIDLELTRTAADWFSGRKEHAGKLVNLLIEKIHNSSTAILSQKDNP